MPTKLSAAMLLLVPLLSPVSALGETEWTATVSQWAVGYDSGTQAPYCRLYWDSAVGKTAEFRASATEAMWLLGKDSWNIPPGTKTMVHVSGHKTEFRVPAEYFDKNNLRLWNTPDASGGDPVKNLVTKVFSGMADVEISFSGDEADWVLPLSRVAPLYPDFVACMKRLTAGGSAKIESATSEPF